MRRVLLFSALVFYLPTTLGAAPIGYVFTATLTPSVSMGDAGLFPEFREGKTYKATGRIEYDPQSYDVMTYTVSLQGIDFICQDYVETEPWNDTTYGDVIWAWESLPDLQEPGGTQPGSYVDDIYLTLYDPTGTALSETDARYPFTFPSTLANFSTGDLLISAWRRELFDDSSGEWREAYLNLSGPLDRVHRVPEPATGLLFGLGCVAIVRMLGDRRRES